MQHLNTSEDYSNLIQSGKPDIILQKEILLKPEELVQVLNDLINDHTWYNPNLITEFVGNDEQNRRIYKQKDTTIKFMPLDSITILEQKDIGEEGFDIVLKGRHALNEKLFNYECHHRIIPQKDGSLLVAVIRFDGLVGLPGMRNLVSGFYRQIYIKALERLKHNSESGMYSSLITPKIPLVQLADEA